MNKTIQTLHARCLPEALLAVVLFQTLPLQAELWGIKTHDPLSQAPSTLFRIDPETCQELGVGEIGLDGDLIHVDALAIGFNSELYAFELAGGDSRLLQLDPVSAQASVSGPWLPGRQIRGACMRLGGSLLVLDDATGEILDIDPLDGTELTAPRSLFWTGGSLAIDFGVGDLTQAENGQFLFASENRIFQLDPVSGTLGLYFEDTAPMSDGQLPWMCGLAWVEGANQPLHAYEVSHHDAVFSYEYSDWLNRVTCVAHVVPDYNAGRGDLAALPAAWIELLSITVQDDLAQLEGLARPGLWVWVEYSLAWNPQAWIQLPTTLQEAIGPGPEGVPLFWDNLDASAELGFFRLRAATELPVFDN